MAVAREAGRMEVMKSTAIASIGALLFGVVLTGCAANDASTPASSSAQETASTSEANTTDSASDMADEGITQFGKANTTETGVKVVVYPPTAITMSTGTKASLFRVEVTGPAGSVTDISTARPSALRDGKHAQWTMGTGTTEFHLLANIRPGRTAEAKLAFEGVPTGTWDFDLKVGEDTLMWSGDIK